MDRELSKDLDPDLLDCVVDLLGLEAQRDKDRAIRSVKEIAEAFQSRKGSAVRWKQILEELQQIETDIKSFLVTIGQSSEITISRMEWHPAFSPKFSELVPLLERFRDVARSKAEELAEELKEFKLDGRRSSYPEPDHNMVEFVRDCLREFENYQPGKASSTAEGAFRTFVSVVYELVTGQKEVDLERRVKRVMGEWRSAKET